MTIVASNSHKRRPKNARVLYAVLFLVAFGVLLSTKLATSSRSLSGRVEHYSESESLKVAGVTTTPGSSSSIEQQAPVSQFNDTAKSGRIELDAISTTSDLLKYKGFRIERAYLKHDRTSTATIKRGARVLARHSKGEDRFGHDSTFFGLTPLLGGNEKQLIVAQFTGGAHCCYQYWIYELRPKFRLIFDGTEYEIGDGFDPIAFQDLDGDGSYEFTQKIITFDYSLDCYTCTPQPTMVFKYDPQLHKYLPANRRFVSYVLKDARAEIKKLREMLKVPEAESDPIAIEYYFFDILLSYIYAGKEKEAWRLCERLADYGGDCPWRRKIRKELKTDSLYRFIYSR